MPPSETAPPPSLPILRQDLRILTDQKGPGGSPAWLLHDLPRNRFFRLGWLESEMLRHWERVTDMTQLVACINQESTVQVSAQQVQNFIHFLTINHLIQPRSAQEMGVLQAEIKQKMGWWRWLLHHYLFFTIPLFHPDRFLTALLKRLPWLVQPGFVAALLCLGLGGLYLVSRRWDSFITTFPQLFCWQGAATLAVALVVAKAAHELGHALLAKSYGCHIPSMGVAFLVLWPVLYADTTDVWRLADRTKRLKVAAAGMTAELLLAGIATLLWNFTQDGPLKSALLALATVSWVTALLINGNPLMRFDGYFLLSDWLEVPNLQERAFALGRWQLRRLLLGLPEGPPEPLPPRRQRLLILFAWGVWIYRFFLFLGIALLVYHFFFKLLGIFLMLVEISWFILHPIGRELAMWWKLRDRLPHGNISLLALMVLGLTLLFFMPWQGHNVLPAVLRSQTFTTLYAPTAARVEAVLRQAGESVAQGEPLIRLVSPDLEQQLALNRLERERLLAESQRSGVLASDREQRLIAIRLLAAARAQQQGLETIQHQLQVVAPFAGILSQWEEGIAPGRWLGRGQALGYLHQPKPVVVRAYVDESRHAQIRLGQRGRFFPNDMSQAALPVRVLELDPSALAHLEWPFLASLHGGPLAVRKDETGHLVPEGALYRVHLALEGEGGLATDGVLLGEVSLPGAEESLAGGLWRGVMAALVRESGF
ncbi:MAG: efflux RND transporter periplasmic adaptor subunit [Magnetococcales bacterium]|nr:efflux RND transporter periplasmic adaptor subunit [Magnetococcales bacterium]